MKYRFTPPEVPAVAIAGSDDFFPIRRIFCVGRNYEAHAREMGVAVDREAPFYFTKSPSAFVPSGATVDYPPVTRNYHYEMELVVAIGGTAHQVPAEEVHGVVFAYACGLDMTRRDLQLKAREQQRPWDTGKDFEESAVIAPLVPAAVCGHPTRGKIALSVNGAVKQSSDLSLLIHPVAALVADLSRYYHLQPGDIIFTGTPEGVGPVLPGDRIEGEIENVGAIRLTIR